jgi:flagellar export protein FliJ
MPFRFPLHAVLHLRQSIEHQQELRLRAANQLVAGLQHRIGQLDAHRQQLQRAQTKELWEGVTAAELRFELQCEAELLRSRRELELQCARLQQARDQQRQIFQQARRDREMLESVRDQKLQLYRQEKARREQRDLDDLFLMRRERLRRG